MNFSIVQIILPLLAPRHEVSCSWLVWRRLLVKLREHGRNCSRESGAFLLGYKYAEKLRIVDFVLYDDLDPHSLDSGIVRFNGSCFGPLWEICKARNLTVVADIHVHPGAAYQSESDRMHPMISQSGHIAFILPNFARPPLRVSDVGIYRYIGAKQWASVSPKERHAFFYVGL